MIGFILLAVGLAGTLWGIHVGRTARDTSAAMEKALKQGGTTTAVVVGLVICLASIYFFDATLLSVIGIEALAVLSYFFGVKCSPRW